VAALRRAPVADADRRGALERSRPSAGSSRRSSPTSPRLVADIEADDARLDRLQSRKRELTGLMRRYGASVEADPRPSSRRGRCELEELVALEADAGASTEDLRARLRGTHRGRRAPDRIAPRGRGRGSRASGRRAPRGARPRARPAARPYVARSPPRRRTGWTASSCSSQPTRASRRPASPTAPRAASGRGSRSPSRSSSRRATTAVLVFDEVDAGIGGSTALAVGAKLARLARDRAAPAGALRHPPRPGRRVRGPASRRREVGPRRSDGHVGAAGRGRCARRGALAHARWRGDRGGRSRARPGPARRRPRLGPAP
jgi:DNA repair protein RecN (Recombination protein N)